MRKFYKTAPLPFVGQKRRFVKHFQEVLSNYPENLTIVDLFGGSGLLSHIAKATKPNSAVIYNDYDNYCRRIENIQSTNKLLSQIRSLLIELPRKQRIPVEVKQMILDIVEKEDRTGFVDYITLSANLLFSGKYANNFKEFSSNTLYNRIKLRDYTADGYLDNINVVSDDYRTLFKKYKDLPNVLFVLDPPYLSTDVSTYTMNWSLRDYLDILTILNTHSYIYFTSNKSSIIELCQWIEENKEVGNPFYNAKRVEIPSRVNYAAGYIDIMLHSRAI